MHTEQQIQDIGLLNKGLQLVNMEVSLRRTSKLHYPIACRFINNPDGSLRWMWPERARVPHFLRFHFEGTRRDKWAARIIRGGFKLRVPGFVSSGKRVIYTTAIGERFLRQMMDWAIFTGTPGLNRKLVIWHKDNAGESAYTKLSLSICAAKNIYNERSVILEQAQDGIAMPEIINNRCLAFTQRDLFAGEGTKQVCDFKDLPLKSVQHWLGSSLTTRCLSEVSWYREAQEWLQTLRRVKDERISEVLLQKMRTLLDCMLPQAAVPVCRAHGDFTPQNMRLRGSEMLLIDWELSRDDMPALYDLFHFIYQSGILIKGRPFAAIRREIDETLRRPEWEAFLNRHDIDPNEAEQQYLLSTISHHLQAYSLQSKWDEQIPLLMQVWCEALGFWMDYEGLLTQRQLLLQDVVHFMHSRPYAAMKLPVADITALPLAADLNLCTPARAAAELREYLGTHRCVERIRETNQSATRQMSIFLSSGATVHIDCISELRSGQLVYADAAQTWEAAQLNECGIRVAAIVDDMRYTRLSYLLNRAALPRQYREHYLSQSMNVQSELLRQMREEGAPINRNFAALMQYDEMHRARVVSFLKRKKVNQGLEGIWRSIQNVGDKIRNLIPQRGLIITFSGVDGAGKRTIIEATRHRIEQELHMPVVILGRKPGLLPTPASINKIVATKLGAAGGEKPVRLPLLTYFRLAGICAHYLAGYCAVQLRYVMRGYVVLYDHYYLDIVQDKRRNDVILPAAFTSWWYRFLLKPDLNFLLYAPTEVIMERRQELSAEMIEQITARYFALFRKLERGKGHGHYIPVRNLRLGDTLETLFRHIKTMEAAA